jgi:hypothetical protein
MRDFWRVTQRKFFHSLKSALIIEAHVVEGDSFLELYQKGSLEKSLIHRSKNSDYACDCYLSWKINMNLKTSFILEAVLRILAYAMNKYYCLFSFIGGRGECTPSPPHFGGPCPQPPHTLCLWIVIIQFVNCYNNWWCFYSKVNSESLDIRVR